LNIGLHFLLLQPAQSQNPQMKRNSANTNRPGQQQQQQQGLGGPMGGQAPGQAPTTHPPNTPSMYAPGQGAGSMLRKPSASSPYRAPAPPVSPPSVPSNYAPNYPQQAPSTPQSAVPMGTGSLRRNNYAPGGMMIPQGQGMPPPMRMVAPMPQLSGGGTPLAQGSNLPPPLMHEGMRQQPYISGISYIYISSNQVYHQGYTYHYICILINYSLLYH